MKSSLYATLFILSLFSCLKSTPQAKNDAELSEAFQKGNQLSELTDTRIPEASGLAASVNNPGMLWTHNDSGNPAEVFLLDLNSEVKQVYKLAGVNNRDWEEILAGPGPDPSKTYLYVGEIGDNLTAYGYKHIYRFEEPKFVEGNMQDITITDFDTITFSLQDSKRDTEAILMDRKTKDLYVMSKWSNPVYIYKLTYPYDKGDTIIALQVGSIPFSKIVAGDISKDGSEILIKNYDHIYYWKNEAGKSIPELLQTSPLEIPYEVEPQGEAITWALNGSGFYTLSEINKGKKSYLYFYERK